MDTDALRRLLRPAVGNLKDMCTNASMVEYCMQLGLPEPQEAPSKRERMLSAVDALTDDGLPALAANLIDRELLSFALRNAVQNILWADEPQVDINKRARRDIARALGDSPPFESWENFRKLLKATFVIEPSFKEIFGGKDDGVLAYIHQHYVRNPEDANVEELFDRLDVYALSNQRFKRFIEGLASAEVQVDAENQIAVVAVLNAVLAGCGGELREVDEAGGYPVYQLTSLRASRGRPKNLIFASNVKPDIRFKDAINNDIEIVGNHEAVLVYDRPLGADGLRWRDLQSWWSTMTGELDESRAKKSLYTRLLSCLPTSSPPQQLLFKSFYSGFGKSVPGLPALLPEVWLHWDPKTVAQRGASALLTHRMDFLMLLPGGVRVVIEVDGQQHYSDENGLADARRFTHLVAGQRELTLAGYEVYRFAGLELRGEQAVSAVKTFFDALFKRHGVREA